MLHIIETIALIATDPRMSDAEAEWRLQEANGRCNPAGGVPVGEEEDSDG